MSLAQVSRMEQNKRWRENNPERAKETQKKSSKKWYKANKDKASESQRKRREKNKMTVCDILEQHHEEMKNDPESLTTDFLIEKTTVD